MEKVKVLVVDDSSLMRKLISQMVSSDPELEVADTASNGMQALDILKSQKKVDIILLDIEMPIMDGMEFLLKRRELKISTPIFNCSYHFFKFD